MKAGALRTNVLIQVATETQTASGATTRAWTVLGREYASVSGVSGREALTEAQKGSETTHKIIMRFKDGISSRVRILVPEQYAMLSTDCSAVATSLVLSHAVAVDKTTPYTLLLDGENYELVRVTANYNAATVTVTRGIDGTTGRVHSACPVIRMAVYEAESALDPDGRRRELIMMCKAVA